MLEVPSIRAVTVIVQERQQPGISMKIIKNFMISQGEVVPFPFILGGVQFQQWKARFISSSLLEGAATWRTLSIGCRSIQTLTITTGL